MSKRQHFNYRVEATEAETEVSTKRTEISPAFDFAFERRASLSLNYIQSNMKTMKCGQPLGRDRFQWKNQGSHSGCLGNIVAVDSKVGAKRHA